MAKDALTKAEARKRLKPDVAKVVVDLIDRGWTVWPLGTNHYRAECPCGERGAGTGLKIDGTPRKPQWHARQIERVAAHCPNRHELIR